MFWDTEVLMLPFFVYTPPERRPLATTRSARATPSQRHGRCAARRISRRPSRCPKSQPLSGANRFWTREEEVHVSADVALG